MREAFRLAFGTLTALPVRPPERVDRRTAARAMVLAPVVALVLGALVVGAVWLLGGGSLVMVPTDGHLIVGADLASPHSSSLSPLLAAALSVGLLALLTRGMHLDGLADTADGLGSGKGSEQALTIMRRSDVGPFGVATIVLTLLVQVAALEACFTRQSGPMSLVVALVLSRAVLPVLCSRGVPAARQEGLGASVAGSVSRRALLLSLLVALVIVLGTVRLGLADGPWSESGVPDAGLAVSSTTWAVLGPVLALLAPLAAACALAWRCARRFGGVTGDVLGACVEVAFTVSVLVITLAPRYSS